MTDHSGEKWIEVYQKALTELENAKMRGRIGDARAEIIAGVEKLKKIPGLHALGIKLSKTPSTLSGSCSGKRSATTKTSDARL